MPKRTDIKSILIIGAGPIVIGQACEFDYSGAQACKALRQEGYRVILVNSNPATIMTDPDLADATYIEPITPEVVARIIAQGAARRAAADHGRADRAQHRDGAAQVGHAEGARRRADRRQADAIDKAEDRLLFREAMDRIGLESPKGALVTTLAEALDALVDDRPARDHPAHLHARRHRRRHRLQPRGVQEIVAAACKRLAGRPGAGRGIGARLEGIRDGGGPRPRGQLHHRLLDRERRSDGRPHRRFASPSRRR